MDSGRFIQADAWWESLQKTYQLRGAHFSGHGVDSAILLPKDLFDSAADNMLQNALEKRKLDPGVTVNVKLECGDHVVLSVQDSGRTVPRAAIGGLLRGPVPSETGYGIGLYQVARQAELSGFTFRLVRNEPGDVCFELRGEIRHGGPALRDQRRSPATAGAQG
jgi:signal transduction histidine kinase